MSELKVFISDDEQPARERLRTLLEDIAAELPTKVVGEARNGVEAIELLPPSGAQGLATALKKATVPDNARLEKAAEGPREYLSLAERNRIILLPVRDILFLR